MTRRKIGDSDQSSSGSELDDDYDEVDDLSDMKKTIEAMTPGSEERKMAAREFKRLKRIPQGSVENGVIRSYVRLCSDNSLYLLTYCLKITSSNGLRPCLGLGPLLMISIWWRSPLFVISHSLIEQGRSWMRTTLDWKRLNAD